MLREDVERILKKDIPDLAGKEIWIWGAGNTAQLYYEGLKRIENEDFTIAGYIDNNPLKIGKEFCGKQVISAQQMEKKKKICVLICTIRLETIQEISRQLEKLQIEWHLIDEVILKMHATEVLKCYDVIEDDISKKIYAELIKWRTTGKKPKIELRTGNPYFCMDRFSIADPEEVFVDCGAYIGDTISEYIKQKSGVFKKIIAFEPDEANYVKLQKTVEQEEKKWRLEKNKIEVYPYGIAEKNSKIKFVHYEANEGLGSKFSEAVSEGESGKIVSLDKFVKEPYTFLKADIESYEYKMLQGAREGIKKYKPLLAICIYHNAVDMYTIPLLVKKILPEYKIAIRHHLDDLSETVMYAWI